LTINRWLDLRCFRTSVLAWWGQRGCTPFSAGGALVSCASSPIQNHHIPCKKPSHSVYKTIQNSSSTRVLRLASYGVWSVCGEVFFKAEAAVSKET
jgi:hypothetical protein